jgi:hypothetical protein
MLSSCLPEGAEVGVCAKGRSRRNGFDPDIWKAWSDHGSNICSNEKCYSKLEILLTQESSRLKDSSSGSDAREAKFPSSAKAHQISAGFESDYHVSHESSAHEQVLVVTSICSFY